MNMRMCLCHVHRLCLLMLMTGLCYGQLIHSTSDISVKIGRYVYLTSSSIHFAPIKPSETCKIEVDNNDPITQRTGTLVPQVFDCKFGDRTIKYVHNGSPLLTKDKIKLYAHKFTNSKTVTQTFYLTVNIVNATYNIAAIIQPLRVKSFYAISNAIDSTVIRFNYKSSNDVSCTIGFAKYHSAWPVVGHMVMGKSQRSVNAVTKNCREFLFMDIRYEHLKAPTPNVDYLPLTVTLYDPSISSDVITERFYLAIFIEEAFYNSPPRASFINMFILDVEQYTLARIVPGIISARDYETPMHRLVFNVSKPLGVDQGYLVNLNDHTRRVTSFTQHDLENHMIGYQPPGVSYLQRKVYEVGFTIFDGHFEHSMPIMLHIAVRPSSTNAPRVSINTGLILLEGQSRVIKPSNLQVVDRDNVNDVKIFIKGGLKHGRVEVNRRQVVYFTSRDIRYGRVKYIHNGGDSTKDHIELRITDGLGTVRTNVPVTIISQDDTPPFLVTNAGLELNEGETAIIGKNLLKARDSDSLDSNIVFTIVSPPLYGKILLKVAKQSSGYRINSFTQTQINNAQVYYKHGGKEVFKDSVKFTVRDRNDPPNVSRLQTFYVHVNPVNDNPPILCNSATRAMYIKETDIAYISRSQLCYTDAETSDDNLLYTIMAPPYFVYSSGREDAGRIVSTHRFSSFNKKTDMPPITKFKQADINHLKLAYISPPKDIGSEARLVRFLYSVRDTKGNRVTGQHFDIEVQPVNNKKPRFNTNKLLVEEGGMLSISTNQLSATDDDTEMEDLTFVCKSLPHYGTLQKNGIMMGKGSSFKIKDLHQDAIRYLHDGSEVVVDTFILYVTDGVHRVSKVISVDIIPVDDQAPRLSENLHAHLIVSEGGEAVITPSVLAARDEDTDDEVLTFVIVKQPMYGKIQIGTNTVIKFSQQNVKDGIIKFVHTTNEIGSKPKLDSVTFIVSDQVYPVPSNLPIYDLNITITPVNNKKPVILLGNPIYVNEGSQFTLTKDSLDVRDLDTEATKLNLIISKQPQWGYLENTKPSAGSRKMSIGKRINSFALWDIYEGTVNYIQNNHVGVEPLYDSVELYTTDGKFESPRVTMALSIIPQNDEVPNVMLQNFIVAEGGHMTIDQSMLDAIDLDIPKDNVRFKIFKRPKHGRLITKTFSGTGLMDFTADQLQSGLKLIYSHDGSETRQDHFTLRVTDGYHTTYKTCNITITSINDQLPRLLRNEGLDVTYKETAYISRSVLQALDKDNNGKHLFYIVTGVPKKGVLEWRLDNRLPKPNSRWRVIKKGQKFTQYDVDMNRVRYRHTKGGADFVTDAFYFVLSDGLNKRPIDTFDISVKNLKKVKIMELTNKGLKINEGDSIVITPKLLRASDDSTKPDDIVFAVTLPPLLGQLQYSKKASFPITSFTQFDINEGRVIYNHLSKSDITNDEFNFTVTNGLSGTIDGSFNILINPQDKHCPTLKVNSVMEVIQGTEKAMTPSHLRVDDPDTPEHNLTFILTKGSRYGNIYNRGMLITHTFTQYDIDHGYISYESFDTFTGTDSLFMKISDGKHNGYYINKTLMHEAFKFVIRVNRLVNDTPKLRVNKSPRSLEYLGRGRYGFILSEKNLKATDSDTNPSQLIYVITKKPRNGHLENVVSKRFVRRRFSQKDINDKSIWYIVNKDVHTFNDTFQFRIEDKRGNVLNRQSLKLMWSYVEFVKTDYIVCENIGVISVGLMRSGWLKESAFVAVNVRELSAKSGSDFIPNPVAQVQFDPGVAHSTWTVTIRNDGEEDEGSEKFKLMLNQPVNTILGKRDRARIQIINAKNGKCAQYIGMMSKHLPGSVRAMYLKNVHNHPFVQRELSEPTNALLPTMSAKAGARSAQRDQAKGLKKKRRRRRRRRRKGRKRGRKKRKRRKGRKKRRKSRNITTARPKVAGDLFDGSSSNGIKVAKKCDMGIKGLLHFDFKANQMYNCDGTQWRQWQPQRSGDEPKVDTRNACPPGWVQFMTRCYKFINNRLTWDRAEQFCLSTHNAHLATVLSADHNLWLSRLSGKNAYWIGLNDKAQTNRWLFVTGDPIAYTNWRHGGPRVRRRHKKNCVFVNRHGKWKNKRCHHPRARFICERDISHTPSAGFFFGFK